MSELLCKNKYFLENILALPRKNIIFAPQMYKYLGVDWI